MLVVIPLIYSISPYTPVDLLGVFHVDEIAYCLQTFGRTLALSPRVSLPPQPWSGRAGVAAGVHTSRVNRPRVHVLVNVCMNRYHVCNMYRYMYVCMYRQLNALGRRHDP